MQEEVVAELERYLDAEADREHVHAIHAEAEALDARDQVSGLVASRSRVPQGVVTRVFGVGEHLGAVVEVVIGVQARDTAPGAPALAGRAQPNRAVRCW